MSRNFTPQTYPSLVAVLHKCVLRAPNGLTAHEVAELVYADSSSPYATMMAELTQHDRKFDADRVLPVMDATGSDAPMHFLARNLGGVFIRIPAPAECAGELVQALSASIKESGEFFAETAQHISDGDIPRDQLDRITKEGQEALEAIMAMMRLARETHEKQYGGVR